MDLPTCNPRVTANARTRGLPKPPPEYFSSVPLPERRPVSREKPLPRALPIFRPRSFLFLVTLSRYPPSLSRLTSNTRVITARQCVRVCVFHPFFAAEDPNHYRTPCWKLKTLVLKNLVLRCILLFYIYIYVIYRGGIILYTLLPYEILLSCWLIKGISGCWSGINLMRSCIYIDKKERSRGIGKESCQ